MQVERNGKVMLEYQNDVDVDSFVFPENWQVSIENVNGFIYELTNLFDKYDVGRISVNRELF